MNVDDWVITCPHCGANPAPFQRQGGVVEVEGRGGATRRWQMATCPGCGGAAAFEMSADGYRTFVRVVPSEPGNEWQVEHLEGDVARDWGEAISVYQAGAYQAAVVMCGRTLEAAADSVGVEGSTLHDRISTMLDRDLITSGFRDAMDYVRVIRNVGAHSGQPVARSSAEGAMRFTQQALRLLFEVPGELGRLTPSPPEAEETPADDAG